MSAARGSLLSCWRSQYWGTRILRLPAASYYAFGGIGYSQLGTHFNYDRPVTSELPPGLWSSLANAGLLAHCITAYMVWSARALRGTLIRELHVLPIWKALCLPLPSQC